ncbi:helix-turn-helix domain-containing protein [Solidesulfovibrio sp. C21]|uniref:helix-turn-helix domain-containing protein n=1 Tax=Solidesulfovibrio sp. C21 TaxID=3398613 RepID=UPI0039FD57C2
MITSLLKGLMEDRGMTVRGLAQAAGLTEKTIMRARGQMIGRCTLDTLATIAGALGVRTKDLYEER